MAGNNRTATASKPSSAAPKTAPGHNRLAGAAPEVDDEADAAAAAAEAAERAGTVDDREQAEQMTTGYLARRKAARRIKTDDEAPERERAKSVDDAIVKTQAGLPDMRFATNKNKFSRDTTKRVNGKPDRRLLDNRPDILQAHLEQDDGMPNVIFGENGEINA